jgi:hypothetical protein
MAGLGGKMPPEHLALPPTDHPLEFSEPWLAPRSLAILTVLAVASWLIYIGIALSGQSLHEEGSGGHSLLTILSLFATAFGCYLAAIRIALRAPQDTRLLKIIVIAAVVFRGTMLFSDPIEEIDLYRYLWDGAASTSGVNPFRYSPEQVLAASLDDALPEELGRLVNLRDRSPAMASILDRVHFGELPTVYPPVSQTVFALAALVTPIDASLATRMIVMKAVFVGFDLATLWLLIRLLRLTGRAVGWSLAYGWCPLLLKEISNSGHLDALAVFLTTLAAFFAVRALHDTSMMPGLGCHHFPRVQMALLAAFVLALAVGAKLYPIVLAPLFLLSFGQRLGWRVAAMAGGVFSVATAAVLWPMLPTRQLAPLPQMARSSQFDSAPLPPAELDPTPRDPSQSLRAFLSDWEMNDFLFLLVMENVRPTAHLPQREKAWFSIVPESWRVACVGAVSRHISTEPERIPFFVSRALTSLAFCGAAGWFAWCGRRAGTPASWLQFAFLTLAWFWLLLPTINPWYWTWALPLLPFARARAWLVLSGLVFLYYLRFWLVFHFGDTPVLGTGYTGPWFFDYVITWLEFGPWFGWLIWSGMKLRS